MASRIISLRSLTAARQAITSIGAKLGSASEIPQQRAPQFPVPPGVEFVSSVFDRVSELVGIVQRAGTLRGPTTLDQSRQELRQQIGVQLNQLPARLQRAGVGVQAAQEMRSQISACIDSCIDNNIRDR